MQATERLWRTGDGKLVRDGDEGATELAYTPGDEIAPKDESLVPDADDQGDEKTARLDVDSEQSDSRNGVKAAQRPADKAAPKPDNK